jgi:hypothetical protein
MPEINYGRIALIPKGDYSETTQYLQGDVVHYQNACYICKVKPDIGVLPTDESYWMVSVSVKAEIENAEKATSDAVTATGNADTATTAANKAASNANTEASNANKAAASATAATTEANAAAKACEGIVDGLNTMVDTVTGKSCVLGVEDGILVIKEA